MNIEIIASNMNSNAEHLSSLAWRLSRPNQADPAMSDILDLDLPVNEIPMVTLLIESTVAEREIITSQRNHVMWARTSRVENIFAFEYPELLPVDVKNHYERVRDIMCEQEEKKVLRDTIRQNIPLLAKTTYTVNMTMRDLGAMYNYFFELSDSDSPINYIFADSAASMYTILNEFFGLSTEQIQNYRTKNPLPSLSVSGIGDGRVGSFITIEVDVPMSLRAQIVRHRKLHIADDLELYLHSEELPFMDLQTPIRMQLSAHIDDWIDIIKKRSCWIPQPDIWGQIINSITSKIGEIENLLPCSGGECPYHEDAVKRYTDEDPNPPCPRHASLFGNQVDKHTYDLIVSDYKDRGRPDFWIEEINNLVLGE